MGPTLLSVLLLLSLSAALAVCAPRPPHDSVLNDFLDAPISFPDATGGASPTPAPAPKAASDVEPDAYSGSLFGKISAAFDAANPTTPKAGAPSSPPPSDGDSDGSLFGKIGAAFDAANPTTPKAAAPSSPPPSDGDSDDKPDASSGSLFGKISAAMTGKAGAPSKPDASDEDSGDKPGGLFGKISAAIDSTVTALHPRIEASIDAICSKTPSPEICGEIIRGGEPADVKTIDVRVGLKIVLERLVVETRELRDKARAMATSELDRDPLNTCNRSLGYCLRNMKEAIEKLDAGDERSIKTHIDAYSSSISNCKDKPIAVQDGARRLFKILLICNKILVSIHPSISREAMFPEQFAS